MMFLRREAEQISNVSHEDAKYLSYDRFLTEYLLPNKPVVISGLGTQDFTWCRSQWFSNDKGFADLDRMVARYPQEVVPVAYCNDRRGYDQERVECSRHIQLEALEGPLLTRFPDHFLSLQFPAAVAQLRAYQSTNLLEENPLAISTARVPYIKDWHLAKSNVEPFYRLPTYFREDWLNSFFDHRSDVSDDYRFVYMGPKGSWTPLHSDVLRSYSWSHNVTGKKLWIFFPPSQESNVKDRFGNYHVDARVAPEPKLFPNWNCAKRIEVVQEPGETIFVPSGWHHQVHNLTEVISINHNWGNAHNLDLMWLFLKEDYVGVQQSIADVRDTFEDEAEYESQCQLMLRVNAGFNFDDFVAYLEHACSLQEEQKSNLQRLNTARIENIAKKVELQLEHAHPELEKRVEKLLTFISKSQ